MLRAVGYPAFRRPVARSGFAAFFAAGFFPSIGESISFCPADAYRGFLPFPRETFDPQPAATLLHITTGDVNLTP
jgi:hypothetical protein